VRWAEGNMGCAKGRNANSAGSFAGAAGKRGGTVARLLLRSGARSHYGVWGQNGPQTFARLEQMCSRPTWMTARQCSEQPWEPILSS